QLGSALGENDEREDYLRAEIRRDGYDIVAYPFSRQDSSMLRTLARANGLIIRAPHAPALAAGSRCPVMILRPFEAAATTAQGGGATGSQGSISTSSKA